MARSKTKNGNSRIETSERNELLNQLMKSDSESEDDILLSPLGLLSHKSSSNGSPAGGGSVSVDNNNNNDNGKPASAGASAKNSGDSESPSSLPETNNNNNNNKVPTLEEQAAMKERAQATIANRIHLLHWSKKIKNVDKDLLWHKKPSKNGKSVQCFPCRRCDKEEERTMIGVVPKPRRGNNVTFVQYIGSTKDASKMGYAANRQLVPMVETGSNYELSSENIMAFLNTIRAGKKYQGKPFELALERFVLEAIVQECVKRETGADPSGTEKSTVPGLEVLPRSSPESATQGQAAGDDNEEEEADDDDNDDGRDFSQILEEEEENEKKLTQSPPVSQSDLANFDPDQKPRKQTLREGCIIKYDAPNSVAGSDVREGEIICVTPKDPLGFVLHLRGCSLPLQKDERVKLISKMYRGKLMPNEDPRTQSISWYRLIQSKDPLKAREGFDSQVQQHVGTLQDISEAVESNTNTASLGDLMRIKNTKGSKSNNRRASMPAFTSAVPSDHSSLAPAAKKSRRTSVVGGNTTCQRDNTTLTTKRDSSEKKETTIVAGTWFYQNTDDDILQQAQVAEECCKKRRGKAPHMTAEQLKLVVRVRRSLEKMSTLGPTVDAQLEHLVKQWDEKESFQTSSYELQTCLSGDPRHLIKLSDLEAITEQFKSWLEEIGDYAAPEIEKAVEPEPTPQKQKTGKEAVGRKRASTKRAKAVDNTSVGEIKPRNDDSPIYPNSQSKRASTGRKRRASSLMAKVVHSTPREKRKCLSALSAAPSKLPSLEEPKVYDDEHVSAVGEGPKEFSVESDKDESKGKPTQRPAKPYNRDGPPEDANSECRKISIAKTPSLAKTEGARVSTGPTAAEKENSGVNNNAALPPKA